MTIYSKWLRTPLSFGKTQQTILTVMTEKNIPMTIREICNITKYTYHCVNNHMSKFVWQKVVKYDHQPNEKSAHYSIIME